MGSNYLNTTLSAVVKADGTAVISMAPDVGAFWAIAAVRVSTGQQPQSVPLISYPYAALYQGPINQLNATTFLDDTTLGSGDTSSVISGSITSFGESISVQWMEAIPGDVALMTVYGREYDNLAELQNELAPVPGARFAGTTGNAMVWDFNGFQNLVGGNLTSAPPVFTTPSDCYVELISLKLNVTTSAVAGNRQVGIRIVGLVNSISIDICRVFNGVNQAASLTFAYSFAQGVNSVFSATNASAPLPSRLILPPSSTITVIVAGLDAGDTWNTYNLSYRRYATQTRLAYL